MNHIILRETLEQKIEKADMVEGKETKEKRIKEKRIKEKRIKEKRIKEKQKDKNINKT